MVSCQHPFLEGQKLNDYRLIEENQNFDKFWQKKAAENIKNGHDIKYSSNFKDLFEKMVAKDPKKRLTIVEILAHPWLVYFLNDLDLAENPRNVSSLVPIS